MAEEAPAVQNKWLLVVAILLGLIVATIYNVHLQMVRHSLEGNMITLLRATRDMSAGERIKPADIERVPVPREFSGALDNVIPGDKQDFLMETTLTEDVRKNQYYTWAATSSNASSIRPSTKIASGMTSFQFQINPSETPGQLVQVGDHVDVYGVFAIGNKPPSTYMVLHGATVLTVEGRASREKVSGTEKRTVTEESFPSFKNISVEVSPDAYVMLSNLQTHLADGKPFKVSALNPKEDIPKTPPGPRITNEDLVNMAKTAAPSARAAAGGN